MLADFREKGYLAEDVTWANSPPVTDTGQLVRNEVRIW